MTKIERLCIPVVRKPFKGTLTGWSKKYFDVAVHQKEIPEKTLGFVVYGFRHGLVYMRTSPVIYFDEYTNEIETLNSRYLLVGNEHLGRL
jgi:hypothetical protein